MKIRVEIDCTPEEARALMGLPDLGPLQAEMLERLKRRMEGAPDAGEATATMRDWLDLREAGLAAAEEVQREFWSRFKGAGRDGSDE